MKIQRWRLIGLTTLLYLAFIFIWLRLFYWQVIQAETLSQEAEKQYSQLVTAQGQRGSIYSSDGYLLAGKEKVWRLYAEPPLITADSQKISEQILDLVLANLESYKTASESAIKTEIKNKTQAGLLEKLTDKNKKWVNLANKIDEESKNKIAELKISGLNFEDYYGRYYPEASMAAHVLGFVGKNKLGQDQGYFGIEGALNKELSYKTESKLIPQILSRQTEDKNYNGRDLVLTIKRDVQYLLENELEQAINKYTAKSGEIIVMEPQTGKILALATWPHYDPQKFYQSDPSLYQNPSISSLYEPGSTFKVLTVATGIDTGKIQSDTQCDDCNGPKKVGKYLIRTWNDEYHPQITMTEALAKSDNTAMIFAMEKIGAENFINYLKKFGLADGANHDLQEDLAASFPEKWGPVELATRSFGQGISLTSLQLIKAINAIANQGVLLQPQIVEQVIDPQTGETINSPKIELNRVVSAETARQVTAMMVEAAKHGEAQWIVSKDYQTAGKTGTSQIPNQEGGYFEDKTIASFVGFAPAEKPKFIMLTKLVEPQSSPWAAETAAPLWYRVADKLMLLL